MGIFGSKENPSDFIRDTRTMFFDEHGNLRHGGPILRVEEEARAVMLVDTEEEGVGDERCSIALLI